MRVDRRSFMAGAASAFTLGSGGSTARADEEAFARLARRPSLRELGQRAGIAFGLCESSNRFPENRPYLNRLVQECDICVPNNDFHWKNVQPSAKVFNYGKLDAFAAYMRKNSTGVVGHTLLWYYTVPDWLRELEDTSVVQRAMETYVGETVERFRGSVVRWDVINEQINPKDGRPDGLRSTFYLDRLGPGYMKQAFATARQADKNALLCFNEFGFEYTKGEDVLKRKALLALLQRMRDENVEVDCVGFQSHLDGTSTFDFDGLSAFTREVVRLGYKVAITELDVRDQWLAGDDETRDQGVAEHVRNYLDCVMAEVKPITITTWGYTDDKSWYQFYDWSRRRDKRPLRPLAFDAGFRRKPMWGVIEGVLSKAAS